MIVVIVTCKFLVFVALVPNLVSIVATPALCVFREKTEGEEGDAEGAEETEEEEPSAKEMTLDEYKAQRNVVRKCSKHWFQK